jgi:hypothetical protein
MKPEVDEDAIRIRQQCRCREALRSAFQKVRGGCKHLGALETLLPGKDD